MRNDDGLWLDQTSHRKLGLFGSHHKGAIHINDRQIDCVETMYNVQHIAGLPRVAGQINLQAVGEDQDVYLANRRARAALTCPECGACRDWTR